MSKIIRVLSYNIHKGFNLGSKKFVLHQIKNAVQLVKADLVFLQEVVGENSNPKKSGNYWAGGSQFEYLADKLWQHYAYGKNAIYQSGHHGNAILSMYPFISWENLDVSVNRFESRGILHGIIEIEGFDRKIHLFCTHLGLFESDRSSQVKKICDWIKKRTSPDDLMIFAGDFNDWRERISHALEQRLQLQEVFFSIHRRHVRTFPSWFPLFKLDRIYCRGLKILQAEVLTGEPWRDLSDHAAVYAELDLH